MLPVAALLGGAAGRVALDEEELAVLRIALRAVGQLAGQPLVVAMPFLRRQLARLAGGLARLGGPYALSAIFRAVVGFFLEGLGRASR